MERGWVIFVPLFLRGMRGCGVLIGPREHQIWRTELEAELGFFWVITPIIDICVDKGAEIPNFPFFPLDFILSSGSGPKRLMKPALCFPVSGE